MKCHLFMQNVDPKVCQCPLVRVRVSRTGAAFSGRVQTDAAPPKSAQGYLCIEEAERLKLPPVKKRSQ